MARVLLLVFLLVFVTSIRASSFINPQQNEAVAASLFFAEWNSTKSGSQEQQHSSGAPFSTRHGYSLPRLAFTLQQKMVVPASNERMPRCPDGPALAAALKANIESAFPSASPVTVWVVTWVQRYNECWINMTVQPSKPCSLPRSLQNEQRTAKHGPNPNEALCTQLPGYCAVLASASAALQSVRIVVPATFPPSVEFNCTKSFFTQRLDHFSPTDQRTFQQLYMVCAGAWPRKRSKQAQHGMIILYIGDEAPLRTPSQAIIFENARRLNALVIQIEHRYFGSSQPFPTDPLGLNLTAAELKWFTIEQIIEDTAAVLAHMRLRMSILNTVPVVTVGCSYGGMLSTYHRVTKPDVFHSSVSSSPPLYYAFGTPSWAQQAPRYYDSIAASANTVSGSKGCTAAARAGMEQLYKLGLTEAGRARLVQQLQLCDATALPDATAAFALYISFFLEIWFKYSKLDTSPATWGSMGTACQVAVSAAAANKDDPLAVVLKLADFFGFGFSSEGQKCRTYAPDLGGAAWAVGSVRSSWHWLYCGIGFSGPQALPSDGNPGQMSVMFGLTAAEFQKQCRILWGSSIPNLSLAPVMTEWPQKVQQLGGVVFTNGELDPWKPGSPLSKQTLNGPGVEYVMYPGASHCSDTFPSGNPLQPPGWAALRRYAMDAAAAFAERHRASRNP